MKEHFRIKNKGYLYRFLLVLGSIAVNVGAAFVVSRLGLPLYLDTIGTIFAAALGGMLPGVATAVASNVICSVFSENAMYYSIINVFIALLAAWFSQQNRAGKKKNLFILICLFAIVSGGMGAIIQWLLLGEMQFADVEELSKVVSGAETGSRFLLGAIVVNIGLNLVDKAISTGLAVFAQRLVPERIRESIVSSYWQQKPLSSEEIAIAGARKGRNSMLYRVTVIISLVMASVVAVMSWVSIGVYFDNVKTEYARNAENSARLVSEIVDADSLDLYIKKGEQAEGYKETESQLYSIRNASNGVKYLYIVKMDPRGCIFIFDLDYKDEPGYEPGEVVPFEDAFEPYEATLLSGGEIEPIVSNDTWGWVLTSYHPIKNSLGETVAYAGADVSMTYLSGYARDFLLKALLIFSGFFALILVIGFTLSRYFLIYPISSMTSRAKDFNKSGGDQDAIEASVAKTKDLDIHTGDEVEELFTSVCKMEEDMAEQLRDVRHYADATAKMQTGLIITMADMVESRDSDTGAHVQKTAEYVRIILEGLMRKGYYTDKLTQKYISDAVMSAPLHDVGKINIPDAVLNKPGKLTDEEFEIMKTHTTAGKIIMEKAIETVHGESYLKEARNMAAYHHERWDGKGYPEKLSGEVIPLSARVMAVADVFDALTSARIYKPPFKMDKALAIIQEGAGTQFDPKCVEVFMDSLPEVKRVLRKFGQGDVI
ncbi:MAG: HD domain-containing protein [Eubacterium sp.]|nr:HD domain-containing protein [Eubacterium sp.]